MNLNEKNMLKILGMNMSDFIDFIKKLNIATAEGKVVWIDTDRDEYPRVNSNNTSKAETSFKVKDIHKLSITIYYGVINMNVFQLIIRSHTLNPKTGSQECTDNEYDLNNFYTFAQVYKRFPELNKALSHLLDNIRYSDNSIISMLDEVKKELK